MRAPGAGEVAERHRGQRRLADPGRAAEQHERARARARRRARGRARRCRSQGARARSASTSRSGDRRAGRAGAGALPRPRRRGRAARARSSTSVFHSAAARALPVPLRRLCAAGGADEDGGRRGPWVTLTLGSRADGFAPGLEERPHQRGDDRRDGERRQHRRPQPQRHPAAPTPSARASSTSRPSSAKVPVITSAHSSAGASMAIRPPSAARRPCRPTSAGPMALIAAVVTASSPTVTQMTVGALMPPPLLLGGRGILPDRLCEAEQRGDRRRDHRHAGRRERDQRECDRGRQHDHARRPCRRSSSTSRLRKKAGKRASTPAARDPDHVAEDDAEDRPGPPAQVLRDRRPDEHLARERAVAAAGERP